MSRASKRARTKNAARPALRLVEGGEIRTVAFQKAADILRGYDAGKRGRRTEGWTSSGNSATGEITGSLATVRNRARDLVRNNPYARRAVDMLAAKKIGTGIRARPEKGAIPAWNEFVETCDFEGDLDLYGIQSMMTRSADEAGEVLVRRVRTREGRVPLKLQVLEPDYLDSSKHGAVNNGNYVIAGVEIDRLGRKQAFWLFDQHPGESLLLPRSLESRRVEASEVIHFFEKRRPGQLRGISSLVASMMRLRDLDDYQDAELMRKKIEACFVAFVMGGNPDKPVAEARTDTDTQKRIETMAPGIIEYLGVGEDVKFGNPSPAGDSVFTKDELHAIAVGCGMTYEQLTGDLSGVNFSSIRAGQSDFRDLIEMWRWIQFIPNPLRRIKDWFLEAAYAGGAIRSPRYAFEWTPPAWPYVNPEQDIAAIKEEIAIGLQSRSEKIRERGYDPEAVREEIKDEREQDKKDGLKFDTGKAPAPTEDKPDTDKDKDDADKAANRQLTLALTHSLTRAQPAPAAPVTVNNFERELASPIELLAVAVDTVADGQKRIAERMSGLTGAIERTQRETAASLEAVGEQIAGAAERQSGVLSGLAGAIEQSQRASTVSLNRLAAEIARPSAPVFNDKGDVIGVKKVDRID
jgi:lambda family phage portal protein